MRRERKEGASLAMTWQPTSPPVTCRTEPLGGGGWAFFPDWGQHFLLSD